MTSSRRVRECTYAENREKSIITAPFGAIAIGARGWGQSQFLN